MESSLRFKSTSSMNSNSVLSSFEYSSCCTCRPYPAAVLQATGRGITKWNLEPYGRHKHRSSQAIRLLQHTLALRKGGPANYRPLGVVLNKKAQPHALFPTNNPN